MHLQNQMLLKYAMPLNIEYAITEIADYEGQMAYPEEMSMIKRARKRRKVEFVAGRLTVKEILSRFGVEKYPILAGHYREPIWPSGIVGSISHCAQYCFVAAAKKDHYISIGVDVEPNEPLHESLEHIICTVKEKRWVFEQNLNLKKAVHDVYWRRMIFSAKESVYKCVFPLIFKHLDFHEVMIGISEDRKNFIVQPISDHLDYQVVQLLAKIKGFFEIANGHIYTMSGIST